MGLLCLNSRLCYASWRRSPQTEAQVCPRQTQPLKWDQSSPAGWQAASCFEPERHNPNGQKVPQKEKVVQFSDLAFSSGLIILYKHSSFATFFTNLALCVIDANKFCVPDRRRVIWVITSQFVSKQLISSMWPIQMNAPVKNNKLVMDDNNIKSILFARFDLQNSNSSYGTFVKDSVNLEK